MTYTQVKRELKKLSRGEYYSLTEDHHVRHMDGTLPIIYTVAVFVDFHTVLHGLNGTSWQDAFDKLKVKVEKWRSENE